MFAGGGSSWTENSTLLVNPKIQSLGSLRVFVDALEKERKAPADKTRC